MASIRAAAPRLLQRVQQGTSNFELVYTPHPRWPHPHPSLEQSATKTPLRISVLDSSFNPPTRAHLGLANSLPPNTVINTDSDYSAKLLLLSVKNADKTLKPGDARYEQRLEMMHLLAKSMQPLRAAATAQLTPEEVANAAIAIIDEPTFVGKSRVLRQALARILADTATPAPVVDIADVELTFLIGHDTLARLVSPRYYPSETAMLASLRAFLSADAVGGDRSRVVSAQRSAPAGSNGTEAEVEELPYVREFLDAGRIAVIDMGDTLRAYSSTTVRRAVGSMGQDDGAVGSWRRLVTADVARYIVDEELYSGPEL